MFSTNILSRFTSACHVIMRTWLLSNVLTLSENRVLGVFSVNVSSAKTRGNASVHCRKRLTTYRLVSKTSLQRYSAVPLSENTTSLLAMSIRQPSTSPGCQGGTSTTGLGRALYQISRLQPSYDSENRSSPIP